MAEGFDDFKRKNIDEKYSEYEDMDIAQLANNDDDLTRERSIIISRRL